MTNFLNRDLLSFFAFHNNYLTRYWSRLPGKTVDYTTGEEIRGLYPDDQLFSIFDWYSTFLTTIKKTEAEFREINNLSKEVEVGIFTSPEVSCIIEQLIVYHPYVIEDNDIKFDAKKFSFMGDVAGLRHYQNVYVGTRVLYMSDLEGKATVIGRILVDGV